MFVIIAYRKDSDYKIIDECVGPFNDHYDAARWADEKGWIKEGKYNCILKFMKAPT